MFSTPRSFSFMPPAIMVYSLAVVIPWAEPWISALVSHPLVRVAFVSFFPRTLLTHTRLRATAFTTIAFVFAPSPSLSSSSFCRLIGFLCEVLLEACKLVRTSQEEIFTCSFKKMDRNAVRNKRWIGFFSRFSVLLIRRSWFSRDEDPTISLIRIKRWIWIIQATCYYYT